MSMTWEQTVLAFPILRDRALTQGTCFCKCGCREPGVSPVTRFGKLEPGLCAACAKSRRWLRHERAISAAYIYRDPSDEPTPERKERKPATHEERVEATRYVREYGEPDTQLMETLQRRLRRGEALTDAQVEDALRSQRADERHARKTERRAKQRGNVAASIPSHISAGKYAVMDEKGGWVMLRLERPAMGPMRGGVVVYASADREMREAGVQMPPSRLQSVLGRGPQYRGDLSWAVAALVRDPAKARIDYLTLMKEAG